MQHLSTHRYKYHISYYIPIEFQVTSAADVRLGVQLGKERFGNVNVLVNCAGIGLAKKTLDNSGEAHGIEDFARVIQVKILFIDVKLTTLPMLTISVRY